MIMTAFHLSTILIIPKMTQIHLMILILILLMTIQNMIYFLIFWHHKNSSWWRDTLRLN